MRCRQLLVKHTAGVGAAVVIENQHQDTAARVLCRVIRSRGRVGSRRLGCKGKYLPVVPDESDSAVSDLLRCLQAAGLGNNLVDRIDIDKPVPC